MSEEFTPLHLAAALNIPEICSHLLASKSNAKRKGDWHKPLDLAVGGLLSYRTDDLQTLSTATLCLVLLC